MTMTESNATKKPVDKKSEEREISLVIGTAGHIDHGKTRLVAALTGVDCDRLLEEKKRGITIELGFAPLCLDDGRVVSIIDVPGHERFIRQMVAGASGIDAVMLVVAADESVMPQTREHLAILELLGVRDGLIVVTKADRVEPELLELVEEDVRGFTAGTFLEGKAVVPVSALTGQNLDVLREELVALVDRVRPRPRKGAFFLPIDRAFPIAGFGTVVTGTAYRGIARPGDEVEIFPAGREGKIRTLQVHGRTVGEAFAGQRVAVNLSNVSVDELSRGDVVCRRGVYASTLCFDAVIKLLPSAPDPLKHWQRVRICIGTSDALARVSLLEARNVPPGGEAPAQLVIEEPVVCTAEQRFIIRFYSPLLTIGGGRVVFPYARKPRGAVARVASAERIRALSAVTDGKEGSVEARLALLVNQAGMMDFDQASLAIQEGAAELSVIAARLIRDGLVLELKGERPVYLSHARFDELALDVENTLKAYHEAHSSEAGMPADELARTALRMQDNRAARSLVAILAERGAVVVDEKGARLPTFAPRNDEAFRKNREALFALCRQRAYQPPTLEEARAELNMDPQAFSLLIQSLKNSRRLVLLSGEYLLTDETESSVLNVLEKIGGNVTLAAVRDVTNSSRKFILPILEYFDSKGYTRRVGDVRVVRKAVKQVADI
ncbi:MAG: selenocysteine-specific translation elongation factor [Synergistaceae bacterium]|jgi:selenocysteine-specific elongation factor|nr:selenocysteine-specific translation elongation factor [Synergistaceae bacterium]